MGIYLPQSADIKPPLWAIDPGIVAYNAQRMGLSMPIAGYVWGSGNQWPDLSGNRNFVDFIGDPTWMTGPDGSVLDFDGDDYVNCGNNPILQQPAITIFVRFVIDAASGFQTLVASESADAKDYSLRIATAVPQFRCAGVNTAFGSTTSAGVWYDIVVTHDGVTSIKGYINSALDLSASPGAIQYTAGGYTHIGHRFFDDYGGQFLNGRIAVVWIFPVALTPTQVATISADPYGLGRIPRMEELWAYVAAGGLSIPVAMHYYQQHYGA